MGIIQTDKAFVLRPYSTPILGEDVNPGYTFEGWNTMADGSGETVAGGSSYSPPNDITLYAQWKRKATSYSSAFIQSDSAGTRTAVKSGYAAFGGSASRKTFNLSNSRMWTIPHGGRSREVLKVKNAAGVVLWEKYYRVSYEANIDTDVITVVNAVLEESVPKGTIDSQSKSYGYMVWTGSDLPVWNAGLADVFGQESRLGQSLQGRSVTAKGYNGQSRTTTTGGCGGITLKSISPSSGKLYTKVKLSPYIGVYVVSENGGVIHNNHWYYTDRPEFQNDPAMNFSLDGDSTITGRSYYSRGKYFSVKMTVEDSVGEHHFSVSAQAPATLHGWITAAQTPAVLTFDFAPDLESAGLRKDAKTTKIEFFEGNVPSEAWPAAVNAVCLYVDTLN